MYVLIFTNIELIFKINIHTYIFLLRGKVYFIIKNIFKYGLHMYGRN